MQTLECTSTVSLAPGHRSSATAGGAAERIRVLLAIGGHTLYQRGVEAVLANEPGVHCVGGVGDAVSGLDSAPALAPDVVIVDPGLADADGTPMLAALRARLPRARFVAFNLTGNDTDPRGVRGAGFAAVLGRNASKDDLLGTLRVAFDADAAAPETTAADAASAVGADLTRQERRVLGLMARGMSNQDISTQLDIALPTVKFHVTNVLSKLQVENRTAAVLVALRLQIIEME